MKNKSKVTILIVIALVLSGLYIANSAIAFTTSTSECGQCHTTTGVLTLTSNASGTVDAFVGIPFMLVFDSDGYTGGDNQFAISIQDGWQDNSEFSFTPEAVLDGSLSDLNAVTNEIQAQFVFTPLADGTYTIRAWVAASGGYATSLDVTVSVTTIDIYPPTIDSPPDMEISLGDPGAFVTWTPSDANPDRYEVYDGPTFFDSGEWDGSPIPVSLQTLTLGEHDLTITVWDIEDRSSSDTVHISVVDDAPPSLNSPADITYTLGTTGHNITWDPSDPTPVSYEIFKDDVSIKSGAWNSSIEKIVVYIDGLWLGTYNYTILVIDETALSATDTVWVTVVDDVIPQVTSPADITYMEGDTGHSFTWTATDDYPVSYEVWVNFVLVQTGDWNSSGESLTMDVDGLVPDVHNYTGVFTDVGGNSAVDTVFVRVNSATVPTIDHPADVYVPEGYSSFDIIWRPYDQNPNVCYFYLDGTLVDTKNWPNSLPARWITVPSGYSIGSYNYTILAVDDDSNSIADTVWVHVYDGTAPLITDVNDETYSEGDSSSLFLNWMGTDDHPSEYAVYLNDELIKSGIWNSSAEVITADASGLPYGIHIFRALLTDIGGNEVSDTATITVTDDTPPGISNQADVQIAEGGSISLTWIGTDLNPASYQIYFEDIVTKVGTWNTTGEVIAITASGLSIGVYNYTAVIIDAGSNSITDTALVTVVDSTNPTISHPEDITYRQGSTGNHINWTGTDLNPMSYSFSIDGTGMVTGDWNSSSETISLSVDGLGYGTHLATITLYDINSNSVSDSVSVTVTDGIFPRITQPENVTYIERKVGNYFLWQTTDAHPSNYTVYFNGEIIKSGKLNDTSEAITMFVDGLAVGIYNYTLLVSDIGGNTQTSTVWVTVIASTETTTTTTTSSTDTSTNTTDGGTSPDGPVDLPMNILSIILGYTIALVAAIVLIELIRRRYA